MSKNADENKNRDLLKKLESFGLSQKEAAVYLALLPRQDVGSSKIIRATGLHGQFVYDALEKLESVGLAKHVIESGRKKFSANSPERILSMLKEKETTARAVVRQLQKSFAERHDQSFEVYQGQDAFVAHQLDLLRELSEGSSIDVLGARGDTYVAMLGEQIDEYEKLRSQKNIAVRYIGTTGPQDYLEKMKRGRKNFVYRILPNVTTGLVETDIYKNRIEFIMFGDPVVCFSFTNEKVADGYREFFDVLWSLSKK